MRQQLVTASRSALLCQARRFAAAATAHADPDPDHLHNPSLHSRPHPRASRSQLPPQPPRSSPLSASSASSSQSRSSSPYRFPTTGARGGVPDPFEVLGIARSATAQEIKAQYYTLALLLHPDSTHPSASAEHFATLHRAYALLSSTPARTSYLQTGYGWSGGASSSSSGSSSMDEAMRAAVHRRRNAGAAEWGRGRGGFRETEAGRGAWGGFRGGDGKWEPYPEPDVEQGTGEERYMSNKRFVVLVVILAGMFTWAQFQGITAASDSTRDQLIDRHIHASQALAEARQEAALYGRQRREMMRRRVRENEVAREVAKMERGDE